MNDSKLRAYEAKRRMAYESKLHSSSLYWHAFRTLMHDSLLETQKANILIRGWTHASKNYRDSLMSIGEWFIDEKGIPVTEIKKKKKKIEVVQENTSGGGNAQLMFLPTQPQVSFVRADFYREEKCGSIIQCLADSAGEVAGKYKDMVACMDTEVLPELSL
jgi:hypothetical protein